MIIVDGEERIIFIEGCDEQIAEEIIESLIHFTNIFEDNVNLKNLIWKYGSQEVIKFTQKFI